jgi:hypothetical protein
MARSKAKLLLTAAFASSLFPNCLKCPQQWTAHGGKESLHKVKGRLCPLPEGFIRGTLGLQ